MLGLLGLLLVVSLAALAGALAIAAGVGALARLVGGEAGTLIAAGLLYVLGAVPPTVYAVLWYARAADYAWAIGGPGIFGRLGGGPFVLALTAGTVVVTATWWLAAAWLTFLGIRGVQDG
jgi:hypothetical protein